MLLRRNEELRRSAARFLCDDSFLAEEIGTIEEAVCFREAAVATQTSRSWLRPGPAR